MKRVNGRQCDDKVVTQSAYIKYIERYFYEIISYFLLHVYFTRSRTKILDLLNFWKNKCLLIFRQTGAKFLSLSLHIYLSVRHWKSKIFLLNELQIAKDKKEIGKYDEVEVKVMELRFTQVRIISTEEILE